MVIIVNKSKAPVVTWVLHILYRYKQKYYCTYTEMTSPVAMHPWETPLFYQEEHLYWKMIWHHHRYLATKTNGKLSSPNKQFQDTMCLYLHQFNSSNPRPNLHHNLLHVFLSPASRNIANEQSMFCLRCRTLYFPPLQETKDITWKFQKLLLNTRKISEDEQPIFCCHAKLKLNDWKEPKVFRRRTANLPLSWNTKN